MVRQLALALTAVLLLAACQGNGETATAGAVAQDAGVMGGAGTLGTVAEGVTVTGHGRVTGEPDTLRAAVGVEAVRPAVDEAFDAATEAAQRVLDALREEGVAEEDVQTREFSVRPHQEQPGPEQPPEVTGYAVRNVVEATIQDVDAAGRILAAVAEAEVGAHLPPPQAVADAAAAEAEVAAPPVMPGQQEVGVQLQATWALE